MALITGFFRGLGLGLLAVVLLFEEWGWEALAAVLARLAKLPFWGWLERKITALPRWKAWKDALLTGVRASAAWRSMGEIKATARAWVRSGQCRVKVWRIRRHPRA